jgi:hypothetical protein
MSALPPVGTSCAPAPWRPRGSPLRCADVPAPARGVWRSPTVRGPIGAQTPLHSPRGASQSFARGPWLSQSIAQYFLDYLIPR